MEGPRRLVPLEDAGPEKDDPLDGEAEDEALDGEAEDDPLDGEAEDDDEPLDDASLKDTLPPAASPPASSSS